MKKRRRQRFLSLMLVLCMIASAGMMTPLNTSADSTDVNLTEETQQAESALTGGAAADQIQAAAADTETDIVSVTQNQETMTAADTQTADTGALPEEAAAPAAEQTDAGTGQTGAGTEQSDPAVSESANLAETASGSQATEGQTEVSTDGTQGTVNAEAPAADEEQKTEQKQDSEETEVSWPAQTFTGHANNITVNVTAAEGIFPEGTTMVTTAVSAQTAKAIANAASDAEAEVVDAIGVDISFRDASGNEIEPKDGRNVQVSMTVDTASSLDGDKFSVVHQSDDGNVQKVTENATAEGAVFESGEFSIYVITGEGLEPKPAIATYYFHDAYGNQIGDVQKVKNGETVYAPTTPERSGYKFLGWSYKPGVSSIQEGDPGEFDTLAASVSTTGEVHLYPVFQQAYYVFFLDNQGRVSTTKEGVSEETISVTDVTIPLDSTHSLTGWYTEAELINKVESESVTLSDHNVTLYPKVEEGHYLYFSSGEGASYVKPVFVAAGKNTVKPDAPTRPGYTFKHWSASEDGSEYAFGSTISEDTTLYAVWEADNNTEYTVIFWKQSVNDSQYAKGSEKTYDYAESDTRTGKTGATVSPTINDQKKAYTGFTYNDSKSTQVTINGDGTTILNVYYDRNLLTINFYKRQYVWSSWAIDKTFTGLYGQTLGLYGYTWPDENDWYNKDHSKRLTFLDAFIFDTLNDYGNDKTINLYGYKSDGRIEVKHYKQNLDGSYSYNRPANTTKSVGGTFYFSNKYTGFTVDSFVVTGNQPKESDKWKTASPNGSTYFSANLHIRYTRNTYKLAYYNYNNVVKEGELLYEASLNSYSSYVPTRPAGLPEAYTFQGWFKDKECTVPFDFGSTMPANDVMIYAKWAAPTYTATVHTKMEGTDTPIQLTIDYGSKINENDMPTVKDSDGNIILEGSSSNTVTVTVPEGHTWAGWATKSGNDYIIYNFSTEVYSDIALYPYYINGEKYTVTYSLGEGKGTAPTDSKQYSQNAYADIQPASGITPPEGKTFLYWGHGTDKYYPGDKVKITGNLELTAVYGETSLLTSITYHPNYPAGSGLSNSPTTVDNQANNTAIALEKAGFAAPDKYYFAYWKDDSGKRYDVGTKIGIDNSSANNLYAVWEQKKEITLTANSGTFTYDGTEHTSSGVVTDTFVIDGVTYTVSGYTTESPVKTDAGTYTNNISGTYAVKGNNGIDVTDHFTIQTVDGLLTISKRTVHLKSESASKQYDGTALTAPTVTVSGDGFVTGEVTDLKATGTITESGSVTNEIKYTEQSGFKAGNYEITKSEGTLTVTQNDAKIIVTAGSDTKLYDGTALTKNSYTITGLPEGFTSVVMISGSITDAGTAENKVTSVTIKKGDQDVTSQFSGIEKVNGTLTVDKRTVHLKSESASKQYDGTALTAPTVTVSGDGFVTGEVTDLKATGTITESGSVTNEIKYTEQSGFKADNYTVTMDEGTLTITQNENEIVVNAKNTSKTYDGTALTESAADVTGLPEGYTAEVNVTGSIIDAGTADNVVGTVVIKDASGNDVTDQFKTITKNNGTLTVTKRTVTLTSDSVTREYDGTALTAPNVTVGGDGFVDGEVTDLKATGTITTVGSVTNTIAYTEGTSFKAGNYEIKKNEGTLAITANTAAIEVKADSDSKTYDGTALTKSSYSVTGVPEGFRAEVKVSGSITDVGTAANKVVSVTINKNGVDVTGQFSGIQTAEGTLTVEKRKVTLTSESASKAYDGVALTRPEVTIAGDGFVTGEVSDVKATGIITKVGSVANTIAYTAEARFKAGNYEITKSEGTLTVTQNDAKIIVTAGSDTKLYNGTELANNSYSIDGLPGEFTAEVTVRGSITDAGTAENKVTSVVIKKDSENVTDQFSDITKTSGTLTVTKRMVTLKSESASKPFDGTPLTRPDVIVSGDGFVDGEVSNLKAKGSITKAGSVTNTIEYIENSGFKAENYTITKDEGTLTITQNENEIVVNAKNAEKKYDGSPLTMNEADVTGLPEGYTADVTVSGSITNAGTADNVVGRVVIKDASGNDVTDQFKTITKNNGKLTVTKRSVTPTSDSVTREYNGTALTAPNVTVGGDGFVDGEVTDLKATGTITTVGSVTNTIAYTEGTSFKADNYEIKKNEGTLTITANTAAIEVRADSDSKTYDGTALTKNSYSVTGLPEGFAAEATVTGSITDTGTADNVISSVVIRKGNENVTDQFSNVTKTNGTLTVTVRKVTLTSGSASKAYDGVALTRPEVTIAGDGFVTGEVSDVKAAGSITKVGSATNTIKYNENNGFKASNYEITKIEGTLRITANTAAIKVTADSASKTYDGTPLTKNIYRIEGLPEGFTEKVTVSGTITDAGTAVNEVKSAVILKDGKDVTDQFTNIENASGTLTVNKRTVNLKSDSASKVFDGTALTAPDVTVTGDGFVTGEVTDLKAVGTITKAGSVKNEIRYTEKSGFKADNYTITKDEGILTITQNEDEIVVNAKNASRAYDGTALTEGGSEVIGLPNGYTAEVTVTGSITDVGTAENKVTSVVIKKGDEDVTDQFKTITENNGTLTITKRNVTLTSESQTREYNGTALTAPNVTVGGDGFVDGEATDIKATGSITKAGSAANPITYTEGTGFKAGNYEIRKTEGTLTVTANTAEITVTAGSDSKTYDGEVLTKSTYTINGLPAGFTPTVMVSGSITSAGTADNVVTSVVIRKDGEDVTDQFSNIRKAKGTLTVTKRMVHLESVSASKQYDGTALTAPDVTVSGDGFVTGEVTNLKATSSITDVGSTENAISYTKELGKFKENNYIITKQVGTLTVDINTTEITFTAADGNKEYDGTALTASDVTVTGLPEGFTAEGVAAGSIVNVWESGNDDNRNNHVVKVAIYNGDGKEVTGYFKNVKKVAGILTITPKSITLKSGSATKPFDGKPLTNHTLVLGDDIISLTMLADKNDLTIADDDKLALGIAEKDQITFNFTGSQTYVGSSENTFEYTISEKAQTRVQPSLAEALKTVDPKEEDDKVSKNYTENYEISLEFGELEVTDNEVTPDKVVTKTHEDKTYQIGDSIEFTINVTNIYDDVRTIILQEQDGVAFEDGADSVTFENVKPGEARTAKAVHVVTAADIEAGEYRNTVKAVFEKAGGSEPGGNPDEPGKTWEASDTEDDFAHMTISKEVTSNPKNGSKYVAGETVTYRITVSNDGTVTLTGLVITDDLTNATWTADSLMAGDTLTYTTSYTVTAADAANGSVTNVVAGQADGLNTPDPGTATVTTEAEESEEPENPEPTPPTKPEETVTPTPVPVEPEEPEPEEPTKPEEPTQPEKPVIRPQTTVTPTPLVTVPPTELPSTRPVHTGNTIRKNPDTIQEERTKLVHTGAVRTGDAGMIGVNVIIVLGAAAGIGVLIRKRKKEKKQ